MLATFLCLPLAIALAYMLTKKKFRGKTLLAAVVQLPLLLPPVVTGYLLLLTFGKQGLVGKFLWQSFGFTIAFKWTGAAVAAGVMALPIAVQTIRVAMEASDHRLAGVAQTLGANPARVLFTITLPLAAPGIVAAAVLTYVKALGEFGATITFVSNIPGETQTLALAIYSFLQTPDGDNAAFRLITLSIALAFAAIFMAEYINRKLSSRMRDDP